MNVEEIRDYCLDKKYVTEGLPFGPDTLVFKVHNKMFALISLDGELSINLKCNPEKAIILRENYPFVFPGFHMNKKHWNTIRIDKQFFESRLIMEWIDDSYRLVYNSLPKKVRECD